MKRIQLVLAALAIVATSLAAFSGSAVAQDYDYEDYLPPYLSDEYYGGDADYYLPSYLSDEYYDAAYYEELEEAVEEAVEEAEEEAEEEFEQDLAEIYEEYEEEYDLEEYSYW